MNRSWHFQMQQHRQRLGLAADSGFLPPDSITPKMDPTTLVAFHFRAPPEAHTVELFGSWDNFQYPYQMHHDRRRGKGHWSGCFKFHNIIFDGDSPHWTKPRTGGLKQGGIYWYFYRLNDEVEAYDDLHSYTTSCPLLPGQRLNVIEVPTEIQDPPLRCRSASGAAADELASASSMQTLDPDDKFAMLSPPPVSKVHGRCISDMALNGRLETRPHVVGAKTTLPSIAYSSRETVPTLAAGPSPTRFYADELYNNRLASISSFGSFYSGPPSSVHSSILDVYAEDQFDLSPVLEVPSPQPHSLKSVPYEEDVPAEFVAADPFLDFDGQHEQHEGLFNEDSADGGDDFDSLFHFPTSTMAHDSARPTTSRGRATKSELTRMYSLPNDALNDYSGRHARPLAPPASSFDRQNTSYSEPIAEGGAYDILSPTFSAATLSSVGLSTPFQLSLCSRNTSIRSPCTANKGEEPEISVEDVSERLRQLKSSYSADAGKPSRRIYERDSGMFSCYSLPAPLETKARKERREVVSDLPSSGFEPNVGVMADLSLPPLMQASDVDSTSFAEGVFSELGFLS